MNNGRKLQGWFSGWFTGWFKAKAFKGSLPKTPSFSKSLSERHPEKSSGFPCRVIFCGKILN